MDYPDISAIDDTSLAELAVEAGLLTHGQPFTPAIRAFVDLLAEHCAGTVETYVDGDFRASDAIRARFGLS
jgi:hypothetical protein